VRPSVTDLKKVGAHYAICSLFREYEKQSSFYCYRADQEEVRVAEAGKARLLTGKARFISEITEESAVLSFSALHMGDHNLTCGVRVYETEDAYKGMAKDVSQSFESADFPEIIRVIDRHFGDSLYSLKSLFRDEETPPKALNMAAEFVLNVSLRGAFENDDFNSEHIKSLLEEVREEGVTLDTATLEFAIRKRLEHIAREFSVDPTGLPKLQKLLSAVDLLRTLPFQVNLWTVQNICYEISQSSYDELRNRAENGDETAQAWVNHFRPLAQSLSFRIP
jgi:hypothetical protein